MRASAGVVFLFALSLSACATRTEPPASASIPSAEVRKTADWAFEYSDVPVDPGFRFGKLANGMRYVMRKNARPEGTAIVRMEIEAGSLDEAESERGFAHFVEHMAFNGSTNVPEGEMVRLLERDGLAFGADTNASTGFEGTTYKLDLPRNDAKLLDTALMLMRETVSELTISPEAVNRERGVVMAEMRDRQGHAYRESLDSTAFLYPGSLYAQRFPIGVSETVGTATADGLRAFWKREYVPRHTVLAVIGDFDPAQVEAAIVKRFADWRGPPAEAQPDAGPVDAKDGGRTDIHLDPALPERVMASRNGAWLDEPDSIAQRQEELLRSIGYAIVNRRLERLSRSSRPPFRGAGFGTADVFLTARSTRLIVDTVDGKWRASLTAAALEYRRALRFGFTKGEIAEQVATLRTAARNGAAAADTRVNAALAGAVWALIREDTVPAHPVGVLERFEAFAPRITPKAVLAALKREAVVLDNPLLRFRGRVAPEGGEPAIRAAWDEAMKEKLRRGDDAAAALFGYTDFGPPGTVASDTREPLLGIRTVRFANGVMLNLKRTGIEADRVSLSMSVDGGAMLNTRDNPLATELVPYLDNGGLGKHSLDQLQSILAGRNIDVGLSAADDVFVSLARTTPADLELQLQVLTAFLTDPGYRPEGEVQYLNSINNYFKTLGSSPLSAMRGKIGAILSDHDPRFSLGEVGDYRKLRFAKLKADIADRLANGAIEIGVVGDIDEDQVIALVGKTLGALPRRESVFREHSDQPPRSFTADRGARVVRHTGPKDQALLRFTWPTRDDGDPMETITLELLERVVRIELTDSLREALGKAYSPSAASVPSRAWKGYGTFGIAASVDVADVEETRAAVLDTVRRTGNEPIADDVFLRARQPLLENYHNALKSNAGWLGLVDRAQSEPDRIERFQKASERALALTPAHVQAMAKRYLDPARAVEITVLPEDASPADAAAVAAPAG